VVTAIAVRDGQVVKKGQLLVSLEPTETVADRDRLKGETGAAQLEAARMQTVALGAPFAAPAGAATVAEREADAERAALLAKIAGIDHQIEQLRAQIIEAKAWRRASPPCCRST
jgi:membrane fusion protein, hemolysin D